MVGFHIFTPHPSTHHIHHTSLSPSHPPGVASPFHGRHTSHHLSPCMYSTTHHTRATYTLPSYKYITFTKALTNTTLKHYVVYGVVVGEELRFFLLPFLFESILELCFPCRPQHTYMYRFCADAGLLETGNEARGDECRQSEHVKINAPLFSS